MLQGQELNTVAEGADQEQLTVLVPDRAERAHLWQRNQAPPGYWRVVPGPRQEGAVPCLRLAGLR